EGYEYGSFHFLEPSFLHNYTDSTSKVSTGCKNMGFWVRWLQKAFVKNFFDFLLTILPTTNSLNKRENHNQ
ncbi:hypothetical protein ABNC11_14695, partial [Paenibacillus larvae]